MSVHSAHRLARHVAVMVGALVVLSTVGTPASAGGWAVGSIDAVPEATAGGSVEVGFTILQHGVTPVDLADDVGIEIVQADGSVEFFASASEGAIGHYVATVELPATSGDYSWSVRMGWFGTQDLGTLEVLPSDRPDNSLGASAWMAARWVMLALTIVLATVAVSDVALARRRAQQISS